MQAVIYFWYFYSDNRNAPQTMKQLCLNLQETFIVRLCKSTHVLFFAFVYAPVSLSACVCLRLLARYRPVTQ